MSDVVRARVRDVEKNIGRALAESNPDITILEGQPITSPDGQPLPPVRVAAAPDPVEGYDAHTIDDLKAEIARRVDTRGETGLGIEVAAPGNKPQIIAALEADDAALAADHTDTSNPAGGPQ